MMIKVQAVMKVLFFYRKKVHFQGYKVSSLSTPATVFSNFEIYRQVTFHIRNCVTSLIKQLYVLFKQSITLTTNQPSEKFHLKYEKVTGCHGNSLAKFPKCNPSNN